jgi:Holliday junction resolvase RusA-like endonuclease
MITLTIPGEPVAKGRPRMMKSGIAFTPTKTRNYETLVKELYIIENRDKPMLEEELFVLIKAYFTIPKSWSKVKRNMAINGLILPTNKRDCDNIAKSVLDALNCLAYKDDGQVTTLLVMKRYSEKPRVELVIHPWKEKENIHQSILSQLFCELE